MRLTRALVVLNGTPPGRRLLRSLFRGADIVVGADGGARTLLDANLRPHVVIGDLDSLPSECLPQGSDVELIRDPSQDTTDVEKALHWLLYCTDARDVVITATQSLEIDHVFGTFSVCAKFAERARLRIAEERSLVHFVTDRLEILLPIGTVLSLVGMPAAEGIRSKGLKWALSSESLRLGERDGIHNEVVATPAEIAVRTGCLAVFLRRCRSEPFHW